MDEIGHRDKQIVSLKKLGLELEDENTKVFKLCTFLNLIVLKLREKLQDAEAKIKQMEQSAGVEQSLEELHVILIISMKFILFVRSVTKFAIALQKFLVFF